MKELDQQINLSSEQQTPCEAKNDAALDVSLLTPRQQDRLRAFSHVNDRIFEHQQKLDDTRETGTQWYFYKKDDGGKEEFRVYITQNMVNTWREMAFHMYEGFRTDPTMKVIADENMNQLKEKYNAKKVEQEKVLYTIWEAGKDEKI